MAEVKPLKLVDLGGGAGRLEEFAAGDQVPKEALPALTKTDVGLGSVDNTSDADKPVSTAQQIALDAKAPLESPAFTGNPTAPTPAATDTDTSIATTAFVRAAMGLFGIGAQTISTEVDLDLYKTGGNFITPSTGLLNLPAGWVQGRHTVSVGGGANYTSQLLFGGSVNHGRVAQRAWNGTAWSTWCELFHTGNILGTVSQSGGVPTGAAFQSVVNANGRALIFPDGTAICFKFVTVSYGAAAYLDSGYSDWPINFASSSELSVSHSLNTVPSGVSGQNVGYCRLDKSAATIRAYVYATAGTPGWVSGNTMEVRLVAMGKVAI